MEYFLILLFLGVYGFLSLELALSFFPRKWEKTGPRILALSWGVVLFAILFRFPADFALLSLGLDFLVLLFYLATRRRFLLQVLGVCSIAGACGGAVQALALAAGYPLPLPFRGSAGTLLLYSLACLTPLALGVLRDRYARQSRAKEELLAASERARAQAQTIQALTQAYSAQRKLSHDFRRHLDTLQALLDRNQPEAARAYLAQLQESQTLRILPVNCRHTVLDALLNQKAQAARQAHLDMDFQLNDLSGVKIPAPQLTAVLGNLLDNALEACQRLPAGEPRWIRVKLIHDREAGMLFLSIENTSPFVEVPGETIPTSKPEPELHGYGLPNVISVLRRQGADWVMKYQEGVFLFAADWPEPDS